MKNLAIQSYHSLKSVWDLYFKTKQAHLAIQAAEAKRELDRREKLGLKVCGCCGGTGWMVQHAPEVMIADICPQCFGTGSVGEHCASI